MNEFFYQRRINTIYIVKVENSISSFQILEDNSQIFRFAVALFLVHVNLESRTIALFHGSEHDICTTLLAVDHISLHDQHPLDFHELYLLLNHTYSLTCQVNFAQQNPMLSRLTRSFLSHDRLNSCARSLSVNLLALLPNENHDNKSFATRISKHKTLYGTRSKINLHSYSVSLLQLEAVDDSVRVPHNYLDLNL